METVQKRDSGLDLVRVVAVLLIIGVHFFYHNGFYGQKQSGATILFADTMRWFTFSCVPLFLVLTGYLKSKASLSVQYYKGIIPILVTWITASFVCIAYKVLCLKQSKTVFEWFIDIVNYKAADYSWYIELYIALFLLVPFLNVLLAWEKEKNYHRALLITLILVVFAPSFNLFVRINGEKYDIIPNYMVSLWPVAYYLLGAMIRKYQIKIRKIVCILMIYLLCAFKAVVTYQSAHHGIFSEGITGSYSDFFVMIITVLIFIMLYQVKISKQWLAKMLEHISKRCLHIYLLSSIADNLMNQILMPLGYREQEQYWWTFGIRLVSVFVISLFMSELLYPFTKWVSNGMIKLGFKKKM